MLKAIMILGAKVDFNFQIFYQFPLTQSELYSKTSNAVQNRDKNLYICSKKGKPVISEKYRKILLFF